MTDNNARGTLINQVGAVFVPVADQDRALGFYLDTLGFEKRADFTYGEDTRWMEVAPPDAVSTPYTSQASDDEPTMNPRYGVLYSQSAWKVNSANFALMEF